MKKLVALYKTPDDVEAFLAHYRETHLPLVKRIPGLVKAELTRIDRTLMGDQGNFFLAQMVFADQDSFSAAMKSPENAEAGRDLANFASGIVTIMTGEIVAF